MKQQITSATTLIALTGCTSTPQPDTGAPWVPDTGDGTDRNPVLFADYSDPDVMRTGDDFCMTASRFDGVPGLPILRSRIW